MFFHDAMESAASEGERHDREIKGVHSEPFGEPLSRAPREVEGCRINLYAYAAR